MALVIFPRSKAQFLLISPFVLYGFLGVAMAWTIWYARFARRNGHLAR